MISPNPPTVLSPHSGNYTMHSTRSLWRFLLNGSQESKRIVIDEHTITVPGFR